MCNVHSGLKTLKQLYGITDPEGLLYNPAGDDLTNTMTTMYMHIDKKTLESMQLVHGVWAVF